MRERTTHIFENSSFKLVHSRGTLLTEVMPYLALISRAEKSNTRPLDQAPAAAVEAGVPQLHDRQMACHLAGFSTKGWTKMSDGRAVDRADKELHAIAVPQVIRKEDEGHGADPHGVLDDDDIEDD